ncbi:MAG: PEGA domain-containing protein [Myxococcales bacterium]|jgi:predicted Zn-dependent protease|nr:PEGA domain-containing protein [Myxococcales bacterium]
MAAWRALEAWDLDGARARFDALDVAVRGDPLTRRLEAQILFEEGHLEEAVAVLDALGNDVAEDSGARLIRDTHALTRRYATIESAHFRFRFAPGKDALLAPYALETLEAIRAALEADLGHAPPGKITVEVYETAEALSKVTTLPLEAIRTTGTVAICKFNKLMITSPKALVQGYGWRDTLAHEYVHLVVSRMSHNRVPIWIHEGLAKFLESRWDGTAGRALSPASAAFLFQEQKKGALIPFEKMHPSLALLPSQDDAALAYAEAFSAIEFLHAQGGNDLLVRLIQALGEGKSDRQAIRHATTRSFPDFLRDWKRFLAKRPAPEEALSLAAERRRFMDGSQPSDDSADADPRALPDEKKLRIGDFLDIPNDEEARRRAHLGELLRVRARNKAAIDEFAQAHARVGHRSPMLSSRYAQALLALGEKAKAEALLKASLALFPRQVRANTLLGELFFEEDRLAEARDVLLEIVGVNPFDPKPHALLAKIYAAQGETALEARARAATRILSDDAPEPPVPEIDPGPEPDSNSEPDRPALLTVESQPFGLIVIDGEPTGRSTPTKLELSPGPHRIAVVNEERDFFQEAQIELAADEARTLRFEAGSN